MMRWMKSAEPLTPLMYPESYPKKIPPNEAKAHIRYAFHVTGASMRLISLVDAIPKAIVAVLDEDRCECGC